MVLWLESLQNLFKCEGQYAVKISLKLVKMGLVTISSKFIRLESLQMYVVNKLLRRHLKSHF